MSVSWTGSWRRSPALKAQDAPSVPRRRSLGVTSPAGLVRARGSLPAWRLPACDVEEVVLLREDGDGLQRRRSGNRDPDRVASRIRRAARPTISVANIGLDE